MLGKVLLESEMSTPYSDDLINASWQKRDRAFPVLYHSGAILELTVRVSVIPLVITTPRVVFGPIISVYTHNESSNRFKELYPLFFIQNFN